MDFSGLEAQVFIGVAVILGCGFVALLCDYLKGVNERLRERSLELTVRLEESDRWRQHSLLALPAAAVAAQSEAQAVAQDVARDSARDGARDGAREGAWNSAQDAGVRGELARLHREVERMAVSVASIAELRLAVHPTDVPAAVRYTNGSHPGGASREGLPTDDEARWAREMAAQQPVAFEPQREAAAELSREPAAGQHAGAQHAGAQHAVAQQAVAQHYEQRYAQEEPAYRAAEPPPAYAVAETYRSDPFGLASSRVEGNRAEPVHIPQIPAEAVPSQPAPPLQQALRPTLQPNAASAAGPRTASDEGLVVIRPEVTPALANLLRVPPRQTPAASLQELVTNVAQVNAGPASTTAPSFERDAEMQIDVHEPTRPNAVKIRVVRNDAPMLEPVASEQVRMEVARPEAVRPQAVQPVPQPISAPVAPAPVSPAAVAPGSAVQAPAVQAPAAQAPAAQAPAVRAALPEPLTIPATPGELSLPSGMHDRATLDFLRADSSPFTGLVVAIGINDYAQLRESAGGEAADDLLRSVNQLVKSITSNLVGPQHFAARASEDEFLIVFNGEIGPAAQRRMAAVSERLWDFQLRSIGTFSVVFSWGATEANEELFAEAIEAATDRMRETRRNRKAMGGDKGRKRVVA